MVIARVVFTACAINSTCTVLFRTGPATNQLVYNQRVRYNKNILKCVFCEHGKTV